MDLPWTFIEVPTSVRCVETLNLRSIHEGLSRAAVRQTPLFDELTSLAQTCYDVQATSGQGKHDFLTWHGAAPEGDQGKMMSGTPPCHGEPPLKKARKGELLFENVGTACMYQTTRALARMGVAVSSIYFTVRAKVSLLIKVCEEVLETKVPQLGKLHADYAAHLKRTADSFQIGQPCSLFADLVRGVCPLRWLEQRKKPAKNCEALNFLEALREELGRVRAVAFQSCSPSKARWLEAHSPAPQAHALNLLFDKVENMVCGAILKKHVEVQVTSTGAGTFDLACSRQDAQKYVDKLNDHCPHGPDAFAVLPSQDPWKLAEECWPHLDWDVEASAAWRDFASLRSQCRELVKAKDGLRRSFTAR